MMEIHPDDVLLFTEVVEAMRRVAKIYDLPLGRITGLPMPKSGMADRLGDCSHTGNIRLVLRCTENGQWCDAPMDPKEVWNTAAHELAHLKHFDHGAEFWDFCEELQQAMENQQEDHRAKVLKKLVKLQASREGEAQLGNSEAAEAFAGLINKMLHDYELQPNDIDYARAMDNDPVIEIFAKLYDYGIKQSKTRVAWQETLAQSIANAHLCTILVCRSNNNIVFVGTKSHATVAEYVYGSMVPFVDKMSKKAEVRYWQQTGCGRGADNMAKGFRSAWIDSFIKRIYERFREARAAAIAEAAAKHGTSNETALIRLDGALVKVRKYIDNKFDGSRRGLNSLAPRARDHAAGRAAGRAAADGITLGRRGLDGGTPKKMIGE